MPSLLASSRISLQPARARPKSLLGRILDWIGRFFEWLLWLLAWLRRWRRLSFTMEHQQQTQWCWAAVSTSVSHYYDASSAWTQCTVVNGELGQSTCCKSGSSAACNQPWYLDLALTRTGNLAAVSAGTTSFAGTRGEIDAGRPLGARIGWSGGGGHFVVLAGYKPDPGSERVAIEDPWYGASDIALSTFTSSYQGTGSWTHSYTTQT